MMNLPQLCDHLSDLSEADISAAAEQILLRPIQWTEVIRQRVLELDLSEFRDLFIRGFVPQVEPTVFLIAESKCLRVQVVVNLFDAERFRTLFDAGHITPHYHCRSFVSRILSGGFTQWMFSADQSADPATLALQGQIQCSGHDVYSLSADRYHLVVAPQERTLTLLIRGPERYQQAMAGARQVSETDLNRQRERLLGSLPHLHSADAGHRITLP